MDVPIFLPHHVTTGQRIQVIFSYNCLREVHKKKLQAITIKHWVLRFVCSDTKTYGVYEVYTLKQDNCPIVPEGTLYIDPCSFIQK